MKNFIAFLSFFLGITLIAGSVAPSTGDMRYVQCREKEAQAMFAVSVVLPGNKTPQENNFYFRQLGATEEEGYSATTKSSLGCGPGVGSWVSITSEVREKEVMLTISEHTRSMEATSSLEVQVTVPLLIDRRASIGGVTYEIKWAKVQKEPVNPSEPAHH